MDVVFRRVMAEARDLDGEIESSHGSVVGKRKDGTVIVLMDNGTLSEWVDESSLTFTNR